MIFLFLSGTGVPERILQPCYRISIVFLSDRNGLVILHAINRSPWIYVYVHVNFMAVVGFYGLFVLFFASISEYNKLNLVFLTKYLYSDYLRLYLQLKDCYLVTFCHSKWDVLFYFSLLVLESKHSTYWKRKHCINKNWNKQ